MAEVINMPLMSDTMTEGVIAAWHKNIGDKVKSGDLLAEIETDKATMEFESPENGVLLYRADEGAAVKVNAILAIIGKEGEDISALLAGADNAAKTDAPVAEKQTAPDIVTTSAPALQVTITPPQTTTPPDDGRLKASPLAKSLAKQNNINLAQVKGSGEEGRIVKRDVEAFLQQPQVQTATPITTQTETTQIELPSFTGSEGFTEVRVSQMRKTIARRLAESKFSAPHFYLTMEITMDKAMTARSSMNEFSPVKISFNDLIVKAVSMALRQHPAVNSSWLGETIRFNQHVHIGVAVAVDEGLLVPVIRFADNKSLSQIAAETKELAQKALSKKLTPADMQGNTFTISNLGMFDIDEFTAIINPPDACILAVGKINAVPAVVNNEIKVVNKMKITLSCDHRVVDGATGAKFLQTLKGLLEDPIRLLV
ncbi:MAG TPA: pyruvate dehydrogenase complex dihydrolipoamide acetyltransferase [Chitinophagales bacterium]|nr:pyruvate dehydrogenase complex dihydrolipoamide acetyltransferase [Chitinophagales bacterium]HRK26765.1 pyruvate dehydrogenase complex dihydrolipoamide acetyltransferase [Chitinophagales bacterium]